MAHSSNNISLSDYLQEVNNGKILVPQFQRDFVWTKSKMIKLAASLLKGYPIGSFLLMQNSGDYASRFIEGVEKLYNDVNSSLLILDGQQRTTSAYQIFYGKGDLKFYFNYSNFIIDVINAQSGTIDSIIEDKIEDWLIALPQKEAINNPDEQRTKGYFPLAIILNGNNGQDYSQWLDTYTSSNSLNSNCQLDSDKFNQLIKCKSFFIRKLVESITSYQASEIIIDKNTSPNIVCTIFETINSTGQKLTILDLLNAKCFPMGFYLRTELDTAFDNNDIFNEFDEDKDSLIGISVIKTIGLLCKGSCRKSDLLNLKTKEIRDSWNNAINFISNALYYMRSNYGVIGLNYFPYKDILPVIAIIINNSKFNNDIISCSKKLDRWYWNCAFSEYFSNATETKSSKSIKELIGTEKEKGWFDDDNLVPEVIRDNSITNYDFIDNLTSSQSAQYKAILNLLTLNDIDDFGIDRKRILDLKENQIHDHHIYPKKFLSLYNIKGNKANTILNRTFISKEANQKIKDRPPFDYLRNQSIVGNEFTLQELIKHCIDKSLVFDQVFTEGKFNNFKEQRKILIIDLIKTRIY